MPENNLVNQLSAQALSTAGFTQAEAETLLNQVSLPDIMAAANLVTRRHFGNKVTMCAIYAAKVGRCANDCAFCAQSAHHQGPLAPVKVSDLNETQIIANAQELARLKVSRYSFVTSGESLTGPEFERILYLFRTLKAETNIGLCASLGSLTKERALALKQAGVSRYHHNLETSRSFFPRICSTHSYDDKLTTIAIARDAGFEICCGGILGLGESPQDRLELAFALKELQVDCVPLNILNPIPGTKLAHQPRLSVAEILRAIALFRLILPQTVLKFAGGRENALGTAEPQGYTAGINSLLAGNYLTTTGKTFEAELRTLAAAGVTLVGEKLFPPTGTS
ncbi:MAG: biotin synthase BioB [Sporomusaceae bacterium]|jgi:biotin synthase|nr:biotin synthase BioB [Sporomusaceae bacterium]